VRFEQRGVSYVEQAASLFDVLKTSKPEQAGSLFYIFRGEKQRL